jgi:hypothetical protein
VPFSEATILSVSAPRYVGPEVFLSWTCSISGPSVWFQLYLDRTLAWFGQSTSCYVQVPAAVSRVDLGVVNAGEEQTDFSSSLPGAPHRTASLTWQGGTFEGTDLAGFSVYGESSPGAGISYTKPLATITAYPGGFTLDGYGLGGYGQGGYGQSAGSYSWESTPLTSGTWHFSVKPFDAAGNLGTAALVSQVISVPPLAPALGPGGLRLTDTYSFSTKEVTLTWLASPG